MSFAIPQMPLEGISVEADSLVGVTLADIDEIAQREISVSQESLQAVAYASDGKGLKSNDAAIYQALKTCIEQVARGERTSTEFTLGTKMSEEALDRLDVNAIVAYLLNDCPFDLYWHDKTRKGYQRLHGFYHPGIALRNASKEYRLTKRLLQIF